MRDARQSTIPATSDLEANQGDVQLQSQGKTALRLGNHAAAGMSDAMQQVLVRVWAATLGMVGSEEERLRCETADSSTRNRESMLVSGGGAVHDVPCQLVSTEKLRQCAAQ